MTNKIGKYAEELLEYGMQKRKKTAGAAVLIVRNNNAAPECRRRFFGIPESHA